jgi:hypothetical protein
MTMDSSADSQEKRKKTTEISDLSETSVTDGQAGDVKGGSLIIPCIRVIVPCVHPSVPCIRPAPGIRGS